MRGTLHHPLNEPHQSPTRTLSKEPATLWGQLSVAEQQILVSAATRGIETVRAEVEGEPDLETLLEAIDHFAQFSEEVQGQIIDLINNPPKPNSALVNA